MAKTWHDESTQRALRLLSATVVAAVMVAVLYWAHAVLIPLALAVFLAFVLSPPVAFLRRHGLGRATSVIVVTTCAGLLLAGLSWTVTRQVASLVQELPEYSDNIKTKIVALKEQMSGSERLQQTIDEILDLFKPAPTPAPATRKTIPLDPKQSLMEPTPVVVESKMPIWLARMPAIVPALLEFLAQTGLAMILVFFILLKREDLRNRLIRLAGLSRITLATKAVDDGSRRVTRFLGTQALLNTCYGIALGVGLFVLGVPHAFLWGILAIVLRYAPYVGGFVAAFFPLTLSLAITSDWTLPLMVLGLILFLEILFANFLEPWLFGHSIGVSPVAQILLMAFWAFLWGPIGLVLSIPMTAVMVVLGRHVPHLEFLVILLGDEPALEPDVSFYQRLTAKDEDEAAQLVETCLQGEQPERLYDDLLLPALSYAKRDRDRDRLDEEDEQFIFLAMHGILDDLAERQAETAAARPADDSAVRVLAWPARDSFDHAALEMFRQVLSPEQWEVKVTAVGKFASEILALTAEWEPAIVCIGSLPPGGLARTRHLCKLLRKRFPLVKIVVGRWGPQNHSEEMQKQLETVGADLVETNLLSTKERLQAWLPTLSPVPRQSVRPEPRSRAEDKVAQEQAIGMEIA